MATWPVWMLAALPQQEAGARPFGEPELVAATSRFALELYQQLDDAPGNFLVSPHSIAEALAMAMEGARGETNAAFQKVLHLPASFGDVFLRTERTLAPRSGGSGEPAPYELSVANLLCTQQGYDYVPGFRDALSRDFGVSTFEVDFRQSEAARARINAWVGEATRKRIPELLPPGLPSGDSRLVLVNAVFLKADWAVPFTKERTQPRPFHTASGADVQAPAMARTGKLDYAETDLAQIVTLPYRGGLEMLVLLPKQRDGLARAVEAERFADQVQLSPREVALQLPKFSFRSTHDLKPPLLALGLGCAFDSASADFSGIATGEKLVLGAVIHQAFVAVDEKGTEAAAATAVSVSPTSAVEREPPVPFVADHPFLFVLRHRATGAVLFVGRVEDPNAS